MTPESERRARQLGRQIASKVMAWLEANPDCEYTPEACDWDPLRAEGWENNSEEWAVASNVAEGWVEMFIEAGRTTGGSN